MNFLKKFFVTHGARNDARFGLDSVEERIVSDLGPRPKLDPVGNPEHGTFVSALGDKAKLEELREDITAAEDAVAHHAPPFLLTLGLVAAAGIELVGANLLLRVLGVAPGERLPLSLALAVALIGVTAVMSSRTAAVPPGDAGANVAVFAKVKRFFGTFAVLIIYLLFIGAITVVRISGSTEEDASQIEIIAQALLMLATAVGPAAFAEWLARKRKPAVLLRKQLRTLRGRLVDGERAHATARQAVNQIARDGARWDVEAARRRAQYQTEHRLAAAKGAAE